MIFVSATRLRVRSLFYLPGFFRDNEASARQLIKTPGFLKGSELIDKHLTFWTLTAWENDSAMKSFRNSMPHRKAMQKLPHWCDEASYVHWQQDDPDFPDWKTIHERILAEGKLTKVRKSSPRQLDGKFPPPKWNKLQRNFKAVSQD